MPQPRKIDTVWKSEPTVEGAGVHLKRAFGHPQMPRLDPFLLLDDFHSSRPAEYLAGFPWHPHRGIETITYVLEGEVEHGDSLGNTGMIRTGDIQWMTAGSGIIHQEMPKGGPDKRMWGYQLWANLPASHKMMAPRYREIQGAQIPTVTQSSGATVRIVSGRLDGHDGPVQDIVIEPEYLDVSVPARGAFVHTVKPGRTVFAYVVEGGGYFEPRREAEPFEEVGARATRVNREGLVTTESLVLYERAGDRIEISAGNETPLRFLLVSGRPIGEPIAWYGPVVMNSQRELQIAFEEYRKGTFIK